MAKKVDELPVYQRARQLWVAVNAILDRSGFGKDRKLREQIGDANDSVPSNISEGFQQPTDKAFVRYLFDAKASAAEVLERLDQARRKRYISADECAAATALGEEVGRMLGGFIKYLSRCDWKDRGRHAPTATNKPDAPD